jgi:hypothetical protein
MKNKTFKHSGDMGDIIFSLPTVKALGGGDIYLDPEGGEKEPLVAWTRHTHTKLSAKGIADLVPILEAQPYINEVKLWKGEAVDYNLDKFRQHIRFNNLSDSHLAAFSLELTEKDEKWLDIPEKKIEGKKVIVSRSPRYHSNYVFWEQTVGPELCEQAIFVGYKKEYEYFCYTFPHHDIEFYEAENGYEVAQLISGCEMFIGNQGFPHALAEAMKKPLINEVWSRYPAAMFKREGAQYV